MLPVVEEASLAVLTALAVQLAAEKGLEVLAVTAWVEQQAPVELREELAVVPAATAWEERAVAAKATAWNERAVVTAPRVASAAAAAAAKARDLVVAMMWWRLGSLQNLLFPWTRQMASQLA